MVVWRGLGVIVPIVGLGFFYLVQFVIDYAYGTNTFSNNAWALWTAIGVVSLVLGFLGWGLNHRYRKPRVDPETGENLGRGPSETLEDVVRNETQ